MNRLVNTTARNILVLGSFLTAVTAVSAASFFGRNLAAFTGGMQAAVAGLGILLVVSCGWVCISRLRLALRLTPIVGLFLSLASHWTLPLAHDAREIPPLLVLNSLIFALVAFLGGCTAVLYLRLKKKAARGSDSAT